MMIGVKRGLFSNEAGEGSAPNVAATASVTHPVKQGLIQALGVFTDTLLVCSSTAFIILISGLYQTPELNGIALTQSALQSEVGAAGPIFVAIAILLLLSVVSLATTIMAKLISVFSPRTSASLPSIVSFRQVCW